MTTTNEFRRPHGGRSRWPFLRHYLEMVVAMLVGMAVLGAAVPGVLVLAGTEFPTDYPELTSLDEHLAMLPLMYLVMLRHRSEYGG